MKKGSLTIVGTGICFGGQITLEAKAWIEQADKVLYAVADLATIEWLKSLNATAEPLPANTNHERRRHMHENMTNKMLEEVRRGLRVCVVYYGHPGVLVDPAHRAIQQAREEGYEAKMLPGVSADACLYADLGIDPGKNGCQIFEATDFLIRQRQFDPASVLLLLQIGFVGNLGFFQDGKQQRGLQILVEALTPQYGPEHEVILYEASMYPVTPPVIRRIPLKDLPMTEMTAISTLCVLPDSPAPFNVAMMQNLKLQLPESPPESKLSELGKTAYKLGRYEEALMFYNRLLLKNPNHAWALAHRGETYCCLRRYEEAIADFNRSLHLKPEYPWALAHRGDVLRRMKHYELALQDFELALQLKPDYAWVVPQQVNTLISLCRHEEALQKLDQSSDLYYELIPNAIGERAVVLNALGRHQEAIESCETVLQETPDDHIAMYSLLVAKVQTEGLDSHRELLTQTRNRLQEVMIQETRRMSRTIILYRLGGLAALEGQAETALELLQQAIVLEWEAWLIVRQDPVWNALRSDPRFQSLAPEN